MAQPKTTTKKTVSKKSPTKKPRVAAKPTPFLQTKLDPRVFAIIMLTFVAALIASNALVAARYERQMNTVAGIYQEIILRNGVVISILADKANR